MEKSSYLGKITNSATQNIKAPNLVKGSKSGGTVKTGNDLRSGK